MSDITTPEAMREAADRLVENLRTFLSHYADKAAWDGYPATLRAMIADAETLRRALPVAEAAPVAVRVKPLEWACVHTYAQDVFDAIGVGMVYRIIPQDGHFWLTVPAVDNKYPTIDAAKDAANADNEARVLSQIDAVPAAQVRAEALREAATLPPYDGDGDPAGQFDHHVFVKRAAIRALIKREPT